MDQDSQLQLLLQEQLRLLTEVRVMRQWILKLAALRVARSKEEVASTINTLESQMEEEIAAQLDHTLQNIEAHVSPALAAMLDNRSLAEVPTTTTATSPS